MKKIFAILLIIVTLLFCSCNKNQKGDEAENNGNSENIENTVDTDESDDYKKISCYYADSYEYKVFAFGGPENIIHFSLPSVWELTKTTPDIYTIKRDGILIGKLFTSDPIDLDNWEIVAKKEKSINGLNVNEYIEKYGSGEKLRFRYRFYYTYTENGVDLQLTITLDYQEVNILTAYYLREEAVLTDMKTHSHFNDLPDLKDGSILILGNSFISTSRIGLILREMMEINQKNCNVTAISRGYATVNTYVQDTDLMSDIKNGTYDAVFICGLYTVSEITPLGTLMTACESSDTKLIVFPAHNERRDTIDSAQFRYPSLYTLDWKNEIELLILNGVARNELCQNDTYSHSTPLAGYIGAHMIYRAIYGEIPGGQLNNWIKQNYVESILGSYVDLGYIEETLNYID